jgi:hypothetical protein
MYIVLVEVKCIKLASWKNIEGKRGNSGGAKSIEKKRRLLCVWTGPKELRACTLGEI